MGPVFWHSLANCFSLPTSGPVSPWDNYWGLWLLQLKLWECAPANLDDAFRITLHLVVWTKYVGRQPDPKPVERRVRETKNEVITRIAQTQRMNWASWLQHHPYLLIRHEIQVMWRLHHQTNLVIRDRQWSAMGVEHPDIRRENARTVVLLTSQRRRIVCRLVGQFMRRKVGHLWRLNSRCIRYTLYWIPAVMLLVNWKVAQKYKWEAEPCELQSTAGSSPRHVSTVMAKRRTSVESSLEYTGDQTRKCIRFQWGTGQY